MLLAPARQTRHWAGLQWPPEPTPPPPASWSQTLPFPALKPRSAFPAPSLPQTPITPTPWSDARLGAVTRLCQCSCWDLAPQGLGERLLPPCSGSASRCICNRKEFPRGGFPLPLQWGRGLGLYPVRALNPLAAARHCQPSTPRAGLGDVRVQGNGPRRCARGRYLEAVEADHALAVRDVVVGENLLPFLRREREERALHRTAPATTAARASPAHRKGSREHVAASALP